jgi:hypothetical protein
MLLLRQFGYCFGCCCQWRLLLLLQLLPLPHTLSPTHCNTSTT